MTDAQEFRSFLDDSIESLISRGAKVLTSGPATIVILTAHGGKKFVVKRYGPLFYLRIDEAVAGLGDVHASLYDAGPRVVYHLPGRGHVMEFVEGRELSEKDVNSGDRHLLGELARATAAIHAIPTPAGSPLLFRGMAKLLDGARSTGLATHMTNALLTSLVELGDEVESVRLQIQSVSPTVVFGHGDLKPRNMMLHEGRVTIFDFEVSGPNYLAFDIASIFRPEIHTAGSAGVDEMPREQAMRFFLETHLAGNAPPSSASCSNRNCLSLLPGSSPR